MEFELDYRVIGERVCQLRRERGMTQAELAKVTGVSGSFIGHIERAEKVPSLETMARLGEALGVSLDWLVLGNKPRCEGEACPLFGELEALLRAYGIGGQRS